LVEALAAGARVGFYEVTGRLGAGAMGAVYRARDTRLGRTVALKVMRSSDDPELLRRFDREARAASALNHPNIVQIYDVGATGGEPGEHYVVMEYVEGETLRRRLSRGPLPVAELLELGAQLTDGLAKAHRAGIVHRDLKPENLMVTQEGILKILDFGLAKVLPAPLADLEGQTTLTRNGTQVGMLLGTLEYMSPEQASGRAVDSRTDQFAAGLIVREMATGRPVFHRDTPAQVLAAVIERDPPPLHEERPDAPAALEAIVARCLQKDPARRYARTDELASELARLAGRSRSGSLAELASRVPSPVSAEVVSAPRSSRTGLPTLYHVQTAFTRGRPGRGGVRVYDEDELARLIHRGRLTGVELVRRDDEERWQPLYESQVFRREVPSVGDPRDAARWRVLRALSAHFTGFFIVGVVMYSTQGHLPFWMGIWGAVLGLQVVRALPAAWPLLRGRTPTRPPVAVDASRPLPPTPGQAALPSSIGQEAARVRSLIEERGGKDVPRLLEEVDGIVKLIGELARWETELEEQTSERERSALAGAFSGARAALERASEAQDRRLYQRQLDVLKQREDAIDKAVRVLQRLRVRRDLAEQQLKQLRLDLSRGAAVGLDIPELSSRLQYIRHEVDAKEEVEEIDAATDQA
jgi:serine/threonine protein kinase